jgi:hypothetical protein
MYSLIENPKILFILFLWTLPWKVYALWTASKNNQKVWFILFVVVNTFGILEIVYIFFIAKKNLNDVKRVLLRIFSTKK